MQRLDHASSWIDEHRDVVFDLIRIYLGIGLFVKGLEFLSEPEFLAAQLRASGEAGYRFDFIKTLLAHYVPLAHIGGGLLLAAGLLTRIATALQIPVLAAAVFLAYAEEGLLTHNQELKFTALVLFLLILILIHGPGRLSVDHVLRPRGVKS